MNKGKKKKRFNFVDFVIIIAVIGCVLGIAARYNVVNRFVTDPRRDKVEISFKVTGVTPMISDGIEDGAEFYYESNCIGTLLSHEVTDSVIVYGNEKGEAVEGVDSTKRDVTGVLKAYGVMSDDGFMLEGERFLAAGKKLTIQSLGVQISVIITEIDLLE